AYFPCVPRVLPPFPPRRSSDLGGEAPARARRVHAGLPPRLHRPRPDRGARRPRRAQDTSPGVGRLHGADPSARRLPDPAGLRRDIHLAAGLGTTRRRETCVLLTYISPLAFIT